MTDQTSTQSVRLHQSGSVATVTLDRVEHDNRFDTATMLAWIDTLETVASLDPDVVLLRSAGPAFSLGRDQSEPPPEDLTKRDMLEMILRANRALADIPGLVVASVQGPARGFAAGVVSQCDLAIGSASASLCFDEIRHGFAPTIVMTYFEDLAGPKLAASMLLTGRELSAMDALRHGLLSEVVADHELAGRTDVLLQDLASLSGPALRKGKAAQRMLRQVSPGERGPKAVDLLTS